MKFSFTSSIPRKKISFIPQDSTVVGTVTGHGLKDPGIAIENARARSVVVEPDIKSVLGAIGMQ